MAEKILEMADSVEIIAKLSDRPNADDGLSAAELKRRFDLGSVLLKNYLNSVVVPAFNTLVSQVTQALDELAEQNQNDQERFLEFENALHLLNERMTDMGETIRQELTSVAQTLLDEIRDVRYKPISVGNVSVSPATVELGSTVEVVVVSWEANRDPVIQSVNGEAVEPDRRVIGLDGQAVTETREYTVTATDERGATSSASGFLTVMNGVYYGAADESAFGSLPSMIHSLNKQLQGDRALTFTVNAGAKEHIWYAIPARYGTPVFSVGGMEGGFTDIMALDFTNASGYTERYTLWASENSGLGSTTVTVT